MVDGPILALGPACMRDAPASAREARFAGSSASQREVALYQGALESNRVRVPYLWLEFYHWGVRLRGRGLTARLVETRDVGYEQITQLVVLISITGSGGRGIRLQRAGESGSVYFFAGPAAVPLIVGLLVSHGVAVDGQVTGTRIPYTNGGYIYRESAPVASSVSECLSDGVGLDCSRSGTESLVKAVDSLRATCLGSRNTKMKAAVSGTRHTHEVIRRASVAG